MTSTHLRQRLATLCAEPVPLPGQGETPARLLRLLEVGREDLTLAKLAEAHWDAVAILAEAGRKPLSGAIYAVWAAEVPGASLTLSSEATDLTLTGLKPFCSGSTLVDHALITAIDSTGSHHLIDLDLRANAARIAFDGTFWQTSAFAGTLTANATFTAATLSTNDILCAPGWYLSRPGFWQGALGPAACWAGGAEGLLDYARRQKRRDPHTLAHLGAMEASIWAMRSYLQQAGTQIDANPNDSDAAHTLALTVRHLIEQSCTDTLRRFARAYGPHPLAADATISRRYQELDLYLRQSHAERDLEALAHATPAPQADSL
jgi:alkylation response protein AidB-like acyl-CoA dehydrogenase